MSHEHEEEDERERERSRTRDSTEWFTDTALRTALTIVGLIVLLFALGQAFGLPLLDLAVEAITSQVGRWLVVAFFALLLIGAAQRYGR